MKTKRWLPNWKIIRLQKYNSSLLVAAKRHREKIRTPGIDGKFWSSDKDKYMAVSNMDYRYYKPRPFKRVYVPKDHDVEKATLIPVIFDRECRVFD